MKKHWIAFAESWSPGPMSYWVHVEADGHPWYRAERFEPPLPTAAEGHGVPVFYVEIDGFTFVFTSLAELDACVDTLGRRVLPRTMDLSARRGTGAGPNGHWLSRLPASTKPWRYREKAVAYLRKAKRSFEEQLERYPENPP